MDRAVNNFLRLIRYVRHYSNYSCVSSLKTAIYTVQIFFDHTLNSNQSMDNPYSFSTNKQPSFPDSYKVSFIHCMDAACWCAHTKSICVWHQTWRQSSGRSSGPSPPTLGASCVWRGMVGSAWLSASWEEGFSRASHSSLNWISSIWHYGMDCGNLYVYTALVLTTVWEDNEFCWHIQWKPLKVCKATNLISEYWMTYCPLLQFKATSVDLTCHTQLATIHSPMQVCDAWALTNRVGADSLSFSALYCSAASWQIVSYGL